MRRERPPFSPKMCDTFAFAFLNLAIFSLLAKFQRSFSFNKNLGDLFAFNFDHFCKKNRQILAGLFLNMINLLFASPNVRFEIFCSPNFAIFLLF